ncbi:MAG: hypothetical protein PHS32_07650 [Rhodoferax sp.]|uniref:hypothetical protein n=1 Tax=Rhodoferax sp. TaxID=50421 RepID=UPI00261477B7|nr:hypothetical protein [Rhodoferax sp.]MDD5333604.1 hypothetical protein [Rhodoferax sp.]
MNQRVASMACAERQTPAALIAMAGIFFSGTRDDCEAKTSAKSKRYTNLAKNKFSIQPIDLWRHGGHAGAC